MALDSQLNESQLDALFHALERELKNKNKNPQVVYNYGVVKSHFSELHKATESL